MTVAAVILAAGASTRFGAPKLVRRIGSRTLVEIVVDTAAAAGLSPVIMVAPTSLRVPEPALAVRNDIPTAGLSRSLRLGIAAVPDQATAAVVLLADQPTVEVAHLLSLELSRGTTPVVATRSDGVLGPPLLLEREAFVLAERAAGDAGLRALLRSDPTLVTPVDHPPLPDVDTPDDLDRIRRSASSRSATGRSTTVRPRA